MRVLKMDLLGAPAGGDLVEHHLGDLHFCAANPGDATAIKFNLCGEDGSHGFSPGTSIREGRTTGRSGTRAADGMGPRTTLKWKSAVRRSQGSRACSSHRYRPWRWLR